MARKRCDSCGGQGHTQDASDVDGRFKTKCFYCGGLGYREVADTKTDCFPGSSIVDTPSGGVEISHISENDIVYSWNNSQKCLKKNRIVKKLKHRSCSLLEVYVEKNKPLLVTAAHSLLTDKGWVRVWDISEGDYIFKNGDYFKVEGIKVNMRKEVETYNIIVEGNFNFFVDGFAAHSFTYFKSIKITFWTALISFKKYFSYLKSLIFYNEVSDLKRENKIW